MPDRLVKILLVEDSESDATLLKEEILQSDTGDHRIEIAGSLHKAINFFKNSDFDAVLLDLNLPDSSGLDTVRYLRSLQPDVPIVVLTGFEDEKTGIEAVRMGAQDYLVKGKSDGKLVTRAVRYAIERKKMEVELRRTRDELEIRVEERTLTVRRQAKFLEAYFQHSLTTVMFLDREFNFLRVNDDFAHACLKHPKDFPGHNFFEFFPNPENQALFKKALRTKKPYVAYAKKFDFKDNPELGMTYFDWTLVPILAENGKVGFFVLSLKDVTERVEAEKQVLAYQEQLRALTSEVARVEENERRKLAIELHDSIGQTLAFLKIELGSLMRSLESKEEYTTIRNLRQQVEQAIKRTRTLTFEMSPPELYTLGLNFALEELAHRFSAERGLTCSMEIHDNEYSLNEQTKIILFRSVRELLVNTAKHAKAKTVQITVGRTGDNIGITIEDDGIGFDTSRLDKTRKTKFNGFGLFSISERIKQMGGTLEINSVQGKGTKTILTAPLGKE